MLGIVHEACLIFECSIWKGTAESNEQRREVGKEYSDFIDRNFFAEISFIHNITGFIRLSDKRRIRDV